MGKLTVRGIENAKPKDKAYKLIDGDGLQLRVATVGKKIWLVRYVIGHRPHGACQNSCVQEVMR